MSESDVQAWEEHYRGDSLDHLPWNARAPDPGLVKLVESGRVPKGHALDLGTGPGHDAVYLISQGFNVIAIDISPSAVKHARANASAAGLFGFFQQGDIRKIPVEDGFVEFVNDRGCFHVLTTDDRSKAVSEVHRVLAKRGLYFLQVFSDKTPPGPGPHRFSREELETLFQPKFKILEIKEGQFQSPADASIKVSLYALLMEKR